MPSPSLAFFSFYSMLPLITSFVILPFPFIEHEPPFFMYVISHLHLPLWIPFETYPNLQLYHVLSPFSSSMVKRKWRSRICVDGFPHSQCVCARHCHHFVAHSHFWCGCWDVKLHGQQQMSPTTKKRYLGGRGYGEVMLLAIGRRDTCLLGHLKKRFQCNQEKILPWKKKVPLHCPLFHPHPHLTQLKTRTGGGFHWWGGICSGCY